MKEAVIETLFSPWLALAARGRLRRDPPDQAPNAIAIVSCTALGDTLLSTPLVGSARASFPASRIAFVVHPRLRPLFVGLDGADTLLSFDGSTTGLATAMMQLRRFRPEAVILAHSNAPQDIPLGVLSGARWVVKPMTRSRLRAYLSVTLPPSQEHIIEQRLNLLRWLGASHISTRMALPHRYVQDAPPRRASPLRIGFQLGAANRYKMWPLEHFAELARRLLMAYDDVVIVLTGISREKTLAEALLSAVRDTRIENRVGTTTIDELPYLLHSIDLLVTNDTGTMHLAIALGVPTVALFGDTSPALIGPYQDRERHTVIHKEGPKQAHLPKKARGDASMRRISVDEVETAVSARLKALRS